MRRVRPKVVLLLGRLVVGCGRSDLQPSEGFVSVPGGRVWYRVVGSGSRTPLLLVHGGPGTGSCYLSGLTELSGERPIILYDQLGSGRSDRPSDSSLWRIDRFVEELAAVRKMLRLDRIHLLGHSWGAALVAEYLLRNKPDGIESVVFAGPLLSTPRWIADASVLLAQLPEEVQQVIARHERQGTTSSPEYQRATDIFYSRFLYYHQPPPQFPECRFNEAVYQQMWGPSEFHATGSLKDFDRVGRLSELRAPVLFVVGRFDEARVETVMDFQRLIPGSRVDVVEGAGHMAMVDEPERYKQVLRGFLQEVDAK